MYLGLKIDEYSIYNLGETPKRKAVVLQTVVRVSTENGVLYIPISMIRKYTITSPIRI